MLIKHTSPRPPSVRAVKGLSSLSTTRATAAAASSAAHRLMEMNRSCCRVSIDCGHFALCGRFLGKFVRRSPCGICGRCVQQPVRCLKLAYCAHSCRWEGKMPCRSGCAPGRCRLNSPVHAGVVTYRPAVWPLLLPHRRRCQRWCRRVRARHYRRCPRVHCGAESECWALCPPPPPPPGGPPSFSPPLPPRGVPISLPPPVPTGSGTRQSRSHKRIYGSQPPQALLPFVHSIASRGTRHAHLLLFMSNAVEERQPQRLSSRQTRVRVRIQQAQAQKQGLLHLACVGGPTSGIVQQ